MFSKDRNKILSEKAIPSQESTWPSSASEADAENSEAAARWMKLRNVLRAMAAFKFFGKNGGLLKTISGKAPDTVSQASSSEDNSSARPKKDEADLDDAATSKSKAEDDQGEEVEVTQQQFKEQFRDEALSFFFFQFDKFSNMI